MSGLVPTLAPLVVALIAAGFTYWMWRDHRSLTSREMRKELQAWCARREAKLNSILEEFESRYQTLRREFASLNGEVADILDDAQRKVHRATMRDRRAREQADRNDQAGNGAPMTAEQQWDLEKSARIGGRHRRG